MYKLNEKFVMESETAIAGVKSKRVALRSAERKWEAIVTRELILGSSSKPYHYNYGGNTCALCAKYFHKSGRCPLVDIAGGACTESNSAYEKYKHSVPNFRDAHHRRLSNRSIAQHRVAMTKAALNMLNVIREASGKKPLLYSELKKTYGTAGAGGTP